jgi:hypothetical protein
LSPRSQPVSAGAYRLAAWAPRMAARISPEPPQVTPLQPIALRDADMRFGSGPRRWRADPQKREVVGLASGVTIALVPGARSHPGRCGPCSRGRRGSGQTRRSRRSYPSWTTKTRRTGWRERRQGR